MEGDTETYVYIYNGVAEVPKDVTHVRVESDVTIIPAYAFMDCRDMEEIELPEGLIKIEEHAFQYCTSLKRINLPSSLLEIGEAAFDLCEDLEEVVLPEGLQRLGRYAYYRCDSLQRIVIPPNIHAIERGTFGFCSGLTEVSISEDCQTIEEDAFSDCRSLVSFHLPSSLKVIGKEAFFLCERLCKVNLHDNVETISSYAFNRCTFPNFRVPPMFTEVDVSIVGGNRCLVSLEISENATALTYRIHNKDEMPYMNSLRNIALPSECILGRGVADLWGVCTDMKVVFPYESDNILSNALKHRFDDLPIHKICYYQSYHDTETVIQNLKREINPWTSKFPGQLNASGNEQDCLGMTPLQILACSTQQHVEMYRLLIEKYPTTLIMKDKWGQIPLLYAIWCNAPTDIVQLLVESYKSIYPEHVFDWKGMILTLVKRDVPLENIQKLVNTQHESFPNQPCDMQTIVMELAAHDTSQAKFDKKCTPIETFRYLLRVSISKRFDSLNVRNWCTELEKSINEFPAYLTRKVATVREKEARALFAKLSLYESLKECTSILELALWKAKIDEIVSADNHGKVLEQCIKKVSTDYVTISQREQCRISCGADIVLRNVLRYLLPK